MHIHTHTRYYYYYYYYYYNNYLEAARYTTDVIYFPGFTHDFLMLWIIKSYFPWQHLPRIPLFFPGVANSHPSRRAIDQGWCQSQATSQQYCKSAAQWHILKVRTRVYIAEIKQIRTVEINIISISRVVKIWNVNSNFGQSTGAYHGILSYSIDWVESRAIAQC